jgi:Uma2 family endonuclease
MTLPLRKNWTPIPAPTTGAWRDPLYPDSDGKPMADNPKQWDYIALIKNGFEVLFQDRPDVFVGGDQLWYAEKGNPKERLAPDTLIAFGRPKGYRGAYKTWEEDNIEPQVVYEVRSPRNTRPEMKRKREFYERHGVTEYIEYDPDRGHLRIWMRSADGHLLPVDDVLAWQCPLTGVRFRMDCNDLVITRPDGTPFLSAVEMDITARAYAAQAVTYAAQADAAKARADKLADMLRTAGIDPDAA